MENNEIILKTEEGNKKFIIDYTFELETNGNTYVAFHDPLEPEDINILRYDEDTKEVHVIQSDEEWTEVVKVAEKINNEIDEEENA